MFIDFRLQKQNADHPEAEGLSIVLRLLTVTLHVVERFSRSGFTAESIQELMKAAEVMVKDFEVLTFQAFRKPKVHNSVHCGT